MFKIIKIIYYLFEVFVKKYLSVYFSRTDRGKIQKTQKQNNNSNDKIFMKRIRVKIVREISYCHWYLRKGR